MADALYRAIKACLTPLADVYFDLRAIGHDALPEGPFILAANHDSLIDPWILGLVTPRPIRYMAKAEFFRNPLLRRIMEAWGTFPVERGSPTARGIVAGPGDGDRLTKETRLALVKVQSPDLDVLEYAVSPEYTGASGHVVSWTPQYSLPPVRKTSRTAL